jgi:hypothetical protein
MTTHAASLSTASARPQTGTHLLDLLRAEPPNAAEVAAFLDGLTHAARMEELATLAGPGVQNRLWTMAASAPRVDTADLVPPDAPPLREVIFHGKNSLPMFTFFQKRFCRPKQGADTLWGYNHQSLAWLTGPGYFVVHDEPARGAAIDYREVPPQGVPGWPAVKPNDVGLSRFVYRDMVDYLRRVSTHVLIGRATKYGKDLENYFVLCREP